MSRKNSAKAGKLTSEAKPVTFAIHQDQDKGWWRKKNRIALASFLVAAVGLGVSCWAVRVSLASDARAQRIDAEAASAEATLLAQQAGQVYAIAAYSHATFVHARDELARDGKLSADTESELANAELPPLSPTLDELEQLARSGDDTAGHLALCAKWRNIAEGSIEPLAKVSIAKPFLAIYVNQTVSSLSNVSQACAQATEDLERHAIRDPSGPDPFSQPVVLKRIYPVRPVPPPSTAGRN